MLHVHVQKWVKHGGAFGMRDFNNTQVHLLLSINTISQEALVKYLLSTFDSSFHERDNDNCDTPYVVNWW